MRRLVLLAAFLPNLFSGCSASEVSPSSLQRAPQAMTDTVRKPQARNLDDVKARVNEYLLRGYRRGRANTREIVRCAFDIGKALDMDPLLILAVAAVESGMNPMAQSRAGAQGVMQVHVPVHSDHFSQNGKMGSAFGTYLNMQVGSKILKDYIVRSGSVQDGLKWYVGARYLKTDSGYGRRVLTEMSRLEYAAEGNVLDARKRLRLKLPAPFFSEISERTQLPYAGVFVSKSQF